MTYREADLTKERIQKIIGAGANVVLCTGGIDDLCLKYFVEANAMAVRRCKKEDMKRIARATGGKQSTITCFFMIHAAVIATMILNMSNLEGEETFDPSHLGQADEVAQERVSDDELIFIKGLIPS